MDERDEREELYLRFSEFGSGSEDFFDEQELVEIIDYATDLDDDSIRIKAVSYGERFYPGSQELNERKALLFYDFDDYAEVRRILNTLPEESFIGSLLNIRLNYDFKEQSQLLEKLLCSTPELEDEWIFQLIAFAQDIEAYDWLIENEQLVASKTSYPQTFYYEMVGVATDNGDLDHALEFAEKLTELEPFNGEFWELLSEIYTNGFNDLTQGEQSIDYALAINPDSYRSLIQKARIMVEKGASEPDEVMAYLDKAICHKPDIAEPVLTKVLLYKYYGDEDSSRKALCDFLELHPSNLSALEIMIKLFGEERNTEFFERAFAKNDSPTEEEIAESALKYLAEGEVEAAASLLRVYDHFVGLNPRAEYFEIFYRNGNYEEVEKLYEKYHIGADGDVSFVDLVYALSKMRLKKVKGLGAKLKEFKENILKQHPEAIPYSIRLLHGSLYANFSMLEQALRTKNFDVSEIDPFR